MKERGKRCGPTTPPDVAARRPVADLSGLQPWFAAVLVALAWVGTRSSGKLLERVSDAAFRRWANRIVPSLCVFYLCTGIAALVR